MNENFHNMGLIDKNKLLEELEELKQNLSASPIVVIEDVKSLVESFEEKEVDLEKELSNLDKKIKDFVTTDEFEKDSLICGHYWAIAKHAFLLGLSIK